MKPSRFRIAIVAMCFLLGVVNYLDRTAISFFTKPIMATFHLGYAEFGAVASAFGVGYFIFTFVGGWLADRFGARRMLSVTGVIWGLCTALIGVAGSFWALFTARAFLGAGEGPSVPAQVRAFNDWLPKKERTRAIAYAIPISVSVAVIIGGPLASLIFSTTHHWQVMFFVLGAVSLGVGLLWYAVFRDNPNDSRHVNAAELGHIKSDPTTRTVDSEAGTATRVPGWKLLLDPTLLSTYISFFALGYLFWFVLTWLPDFLQSSYGLDLSASALFTILPWLAYGFGSFLAGVISDRTAGIARYANIKKHLIWIGLLGSAVCLIPIFSWHSLSVTIAFITIALGMSGVCVPPQWAVNADVIPQRVGLSSGVMDAAFAGAGLVAPVLSGYLTQQSGTFTSTLVVACVITAAGALCVMIMSNPARAAKKFAERSDDAAVASA